MAASRRIAKEMADIAKEPDTQFSVKMLNDNPFEWEGQIKGPPDSPYEGGVFRMSIRFPTTYPFKPPTISAITPIYHPNINSKGAICLDILRDQWSPILTTSKVLLSIISLLCDPNENDPLEQQIAGVYRRNRQLYDETAREWTRRHAMGDTEKDN